MMRVYEFEVFPGESGMMMAFPYDMDGGTQGEDLAEACEMAADWLQSEMEYRAVNGLDFPAATFGNEPAHEGGKTIIVAVNADRGTVDKMSASAAAKALGVTPGRVSQMLAAGQLQGWREGRDTWVTKKSIDARLAAPRGAGRPKKTVTA